MYDVEAVGCGEPYAAGGEGLVYGIGSCILWRVWPANYRIRVKRRLLR